TVPKRRWLRFSLWTMFVVVTMLACFFGWAARQHSLVTQRRALLQEIEARGGWFMRDNEAADIPFFRSWLGDIPIYIINEPRGASSQEHVEAEELFPEAAVFRHGDHSSSPAFR